MGWLATTQALNATQITLNDSSATYFSETRSNTNIVPCMAQGFSRIGGDDLTLTIKVGAASILRTISNVNAIYAGDGTEVGRQFTIVTEDMDSIGGDFNDAQVALVAWRAGG